MSERFIVVVTAGLGQPSSTRMLGERLGAATDRALASAGVSSTLEVVELREHAHDLINQLMTGVPSAPLAELITRVLAADALIVVTPIFSASYSGLFKVFFDVLHPESLAGMPVLIAATAGTARHSLALEHAMRPLFAYLRTVVVPTAVFAATEDWDSVGVLQDRIERAAGELATLLAPSASPTRRRPPPSPGEGETPDLATLLAR